jgi:DNA-binding beta-propeller fold protein YncE
MEILMNKLSATSTRTRLISGRGVAAVAISIVLALSLGVVSDATAGRRSRKKEAIKQPDLVWPLPPEPARVRYVRSYSGSWDFGKKKSKLRRFFLGPEAQKEIGLRKPYGVTTDKAGRVYVTDTGLGGVMVFDESEKTVQMLGVQGNVRLGTPLAIVMDARERLFIADSELQQVICLSLQGQPLIALGKAEGMESPSGLAIDDTRNRLYVVDSHAHKVFVYDLDGRFIETWGSRGSEPGQFNFPTNAAVAGNGNLFVVDTANFRIQSLTPQGDPITEFGKAGSTFGSFTRPKGIAVDSQNHVYVVDAAFNNFQIFTEEGALLLFVGAYGRAPGRFWLPAGAHIDSSDRIYVVDQANARVQVFQYLSSGPNEDLASPDEKARGDETPDDTSQAGNRGVKEPPDNS